MCEFKVKHKHSVPVQNSFVSAKRPNNQVYKKREWEKNNEWQ